MDFTQTNLSGNQGNPSLSRLTLPLGVTESKDLWVIPNHIHEIILFKFIVKL